jgi:hypothetical protein
MSDFVEELCIMPDGAHDDQFDAFDFAIAVSESGGGDAKMTKLPGSDKYCERQSDKPVFSALIKEKYK